jgi:hypothetical protein
MKKLFFATAIIATSVSFGQNTFPTNGNVGIGIIDPLEKLHVRDGQLMSSDLNYNNINIRLDGRNIPNIKFSRWVGSGSIQHNGFVGQFFNTALNGEYSLGIGTGYSATGDQNLNSPVMTFTLGGNVGIGVTNPKSKLEIVPGNRFAAGFTYVDSVLDVENSYTRSSFGSNAYWDSNTNLWNVTAIGNNDFSAMIHPNDNGLAFITAPSDGNVSKTLTNSQFMAFERMRISSNGNVGIGSTNPDEKLTVKGKIHAEEIRVDLSVPADYVFEKYYTGASTLKADYVMPSLAEIEKYTKENKHLPNVPSAQEIKDKGLQVGEMSNILLQKVEELTLYIIEQNKKIEALEAKVNGK